MAAIVLAAAATSAATSLGAGVFAAGLAGGVGGMLGGFIDSRLFATHTNQQGPRLTDLMVQVSTYGTLIPIVYGQARIGGNVIWALPLQEHSTTTSVSGGGKGGGGSSSTETTYTYSATLAVAICEGPITEIQRIWADSEQVDLSNSANGTFTFYYGDESQLPDSYISTFYPSGQNPAYRGMAYVLIENFPLADFGNRIPNFTFEVNRIMRLPGDLEDKIAGVAMIPGAGEYVYDTVVQTKTTGTSNAHGVLVQAGKTETVNEHNLSGKADVLVSLDDLQTNLPNNQWVSVVIDWFADSANPAVLNIKPAVEFDGTGAAVPPVRLQGFYNLWPPIFYTARELWEMDKKPMRLGPPSAAAISRMEETLPWICWVEVEERHLIWLRAHGVRWKGIGVRLGLHPKTAWRHWVMALLKIAARLDRLNHPPTQNHEIPR